MADLMIELCQSSVLNRAPLFQDGSQINWDKLMTTSSQHGLLAWVWDGISRLPKDMQPSRQCRISWALSTAEITESYCQQKEVIGRIIDICGDSDIRVLLLKGVGLSLLYPNPAFRPSGDIDIYLFGKYELGNQLLATSDITINAKEAKFHFNGVKVENHRIFFPDYYKGYRRINDYLISMSNQAIRTDDGYYSLPPTANIVYNIAHVISHFINTEDPLTFRPIIDIQMLLCDCCGDEHRNELFDAVKSLGLVNMFELLVTFCEHISGIDFSRFHISSTPVGDIMRLKNLILSGGKSVCDAESILTWGTLMQYQRRYQSLRWTHKYLVSTRGEIVKKTIVRQCHFAILFLFRIPVGGSVSRTMKARLSLNK